VSAHEPDARRVSGPEAPATSAAADPDAAQVEAISEYLRITPNSLERLQALRDEVHATLNEEFSHVASDLGQLRRILSDAAQRLSNNFWLITAGSSELRATLGQADEGQHLPVLQKLSQIVEEMASTSGTTVQGLQFEDMAAQLLEHVDRKLVVLANLSKDMAVLNPALQDQPPFMKTPELDELFATLERYRMELRVSTRKVVQQQSLESGDIELF
jgi:hypothetical protein